MQPSDVLWGVVKNGVLVLSGFSIGVTVKDGCLQVTDGVKGAEKVLVYPRASCPISRIIMLRGWGYISVPAIRWMHETGVSLIHVDTRGEPLLTTIPSPRAPIPAALRRAQALAFDTDTGRAIARDLISAKIAGQIANLEFFGRPDVAAKAASYAARLPAQKTLSDVLGIEGSVSVFYWQAFADMQVHFGRREAVAQHWRSFGKRRSPRTGLPRRALTPANAILNLLLGGLVAEITIALYAVGLDPFLGVSLHEDKPDRASLAYDLAEPARWIVERWFFSLLRSTTFSKRDFFEDLEGVISVTTPLSAHLAMSSVLWRSLADELAQWICSRLSGVHRKLQLRPLDLKADVGRRAAKWQVGKNIAPVVPTTCLECGKALQQQRRKFCSIECARSYQGGSPVEAGLAALARVRAAGTPARPAVRVEGVPSVAEWRRQPNWSSSSDDEMRRQFVETILPRLAAVRSSEIARAIGFSPHHAVKIRRGRAVPHPRFYRALAMLAGVEYSIDAKATMTAAIRRNRGVEQ
jgi:CRISPR-associated endonuclease Cas1